VSTAPSPGRAAADSQGRVLVVGCGFIGSHVVEELASTGRPPRVLTRSRPSAVAERIAAGDLLLGSAADPTLLARALEGVDHVVYSAGGLLPAASERDPERDAELTLGPVRAVLAALRERPGVGLTYLSSGGTVYGEPASVPVAEDAPAEPFGAYGRLHLAAEAEVLEHAREFATPVRILRCATVYGEHQAPDRGQGAVVTFLHRIEQGQEVEIFGDGGAVRDYVYAGDVAGAIGELLGREGGPQVLNVGSGEGTALIDLLGLAERQVGREAKVVRHPARGFEVRQIVLDVSRLRELIPFDPTPLEQGIARTHRWLATRPEAA
jgi:UDP-glucose 4-epimerase